MAHPEVSHAEVVSNDASGLGVERLAHLDTKLFATHQTSGYSEVEWREILDHLVVKLEERLGQPVATHDIKFWPDGFAGDIESPVPFAGSLQISWFGRIGVTVLGHKERTYPEVSLFLRGHGRRLVTIDGGAFLLLEYKEVASGIFEWTDPSWESDEFGKYEQWI